MGDKEREEAAEAETSDIRTAAALGRNAECRPVVSGTRRRGGADNRLFVDAAGWRDLPGGR